MEKPHLVNIVIARISPSQPAEPLRMEFPFLSRYE